MSTPVSQPSFPDWQVLLLEAIHQRNATQAVSLAQRYVHRFGMLALEQLLESAEGDSGLGDDARAWLLPLLIHPTSPKHSSPSPSLVSPNPAPETLSGQANMLDEAFAPLEIAFPPLPADGQEAFQMLDPKDTLDSARPSSGGLPADVTGARQELVGEVPHFDHPFREEPARAEPVRAEPVHEEKQPFSVNHQHDAELFGEVPPAEANELVIGPGAQQEMAATTVGDDEDLCNVKPTCLDHFQEGIAAPVPTFQIEETTSGERSVPRVRYSEPPKRKRTHQPAPISPALAPWLSWLHDEVGPTRSRT